MARGGGAGVLNRVRHPASGQSLRVVYQPTRPNRLQFPFLRRSLAAGRCHAWRRASDVAKAALSGAVYGPAGHATHYHANYVVPYWAASLAKNAVVGAHIFYRWAGGWGRPAAFGKRYAGREPDTRALRTAALAAEAAQLAQKAAEAADEQLARRAGTKASRPRTGAWHCANRRRARREDAPHAIVENSSVGHLRWALDGAAPPPLTRRRSVDGATRGRRASGAAPQP